MSNIVVTLPNHPRFVEVIREVEYQGLHDLPKEKRLTLHTELRNYTMIDGNKVLDKDLGTRSVALTAVGSLIVSPIDGEPIPKLIEVNGLEQKNPDYEDGITQYDFYSAMLAQDVSIYTRIPQIIMLGYMNGRYS